jgi:hypothetical protein
MDKINIPADFRQFDDLLDQLDWQTEAETRAFYLDQLIGICGQYLAHNNDLDAALRCARMNSTDIDTAHIQRLAKAWQAHHLLDWDQDRDKLKMAEVRAPRSTLKDRAVAVMVDTIKAKGLKKRSPDNRPAFEAALKNAGIPKYDKDGNLNYKEQSQYKKWVREAFDKVEGK